MFCLPILILGEGFMVVAPAFVYLAIPRTATNTMKLFLSVFGGVRHGDPHEPVVPKEFSDRFTFSVVRNPYDRMLSCWHHLCEHDYVHRGTRIRETDFPEFLRLQDSDWGVEGKSQSEFLSKSRVDLVLRYESLADDVLSLPFNLNKTPWPDERLNSSSRPFWEEELRQNPDWARLVETHSEKDFSAYGYPRFCL